jgi:hypothetical protein
MFFVEGKKYGWKAHDIPIVDHDGNPLWYEDLMGTVPFNKRFLYI